MLLTFVLVVIGWIIFRAENIGDAGHYIVSLFSFDVWRAAYRFLLYPTNYAGYFVLLMLVVEWLQRGKEHGLEISGVRYGWLRIAIYYSLIAMMVYFSGESETFIYFQF